VTATAVAPARRFEWEDDPEIDRESGRIMGLTAHQRQGIAEREAAIGVYPLDVLLARRAKLVRRYAELAAVHGRTGTYDAERKNLVSKLALAELEKDPKRNVSAAELAAHANPAYGRWLKAMRGQKIEYEILADKIEALNQRIQRDQRIIDYAAREPR
jgi:hypothetical protein